MTKEDIFNELNANEVLVVSTNGPDGYPQSAVVGFGQTEELELIFGTHRNSRKANNILRDPKVSAVTITKKVTVQHEGTARLLSGEESEAYANIYYKKSPAAAKYKDVPNECYFLVSPTWIRISDISQYPWDVTELTF